MSKDKKNHHTIEWRKIFVVHSLVFFVSVACFAIMNRIGISLWIFYNSIATFYVITSLMTMFESLIAINRRYASDRLGSLASPVPFSSFVIPAYLPNEKDIILETIMHILTNVERPEKGLEVILVYNTPVELAVEKELLLIESS